MAINTNINQFRKELGLTKISANDLRTYLKDNNLELSELENTYKEKLDIKNEINKLQSSIRQDINKFNKNVKINANGEITQNNFKNHSDLDKLTSDIIKKDDKIQNLYNKLSDDIKTNENTETELFTNTYSDLEAKRIVDDIEDFYTNKGKSDGLTVFERNLLNRTQSNLSNLMINGRFDNINAYSNLLNNIYSTPLTVTFSDGSKKIQAFSSVLKDGISKEDILSLFLSSLSVGGVYNMWGNSDMKINVFMSSLKKSARLWFIFQNMLKEGVSDVD